MLFNRSTMVLIIASLCLFIFICRDIDRASAAPTGTTVCGVPCTKSGTVWTCTDISQNCVQDAVNASEATWRRTNEVRLGKGNIIWTDADRDICVSPVVSAKACLCMHRGLKLTGGIDGTTKITITGTNSRGAIWFIPSKEARSANETIEVSGFTFDGSGKNYSEGIITFANTGTTAMSGFKIHNNTFLKTTHAIGVAGPSAGVIYNNIFDGVDTAVRSESAASSWDIWSPTYGTINSVFFEDNTIINSAAISNSLGTSGAGQGGSIVNRYNTYDLNNVVLASSQWLDLHGLQSMTTADHDAPWAGAEIQCGYPPFSTCYPARRSCQQWSQLRSEFYGNININFRNPYSRPQELMRLRGSGLLMFNNRITGKGHMPLPNIYQYSCDSCQSGTGKRYSMHVQNTYLWNNIGDNGTSTVNLPIYVRADNCASYAQGAPYTIKENVDYWNYNANTLNGSTQKGINCGSAAPTSPCSAGDGYWQTSYSPCSQAPKTMADMKKYTQAGKFYKCTAAKTWALYYQPYIYPHPLRD